MDKDTLKTLGLKTTTPRLKILELFEKSDKRHFSVEEIHRSLMQNDEDIAIATIYRVLTQFEKAGIIMRHSFANDHAIFELNDGEHHDHIICQQCGKVIEFVDDVIEQRQKEIAKKHGFEIVDHSLNIFGVCTRCK